jgi:SAM-dependent methyltransferase
VPREDAVFQDLLVTDGTPPSGTLASLPGFHILVPVWGAAYCDLFTAISLPSQLAAGNLPSLPHKNRCLYHVLTRPEDRQRIEGSEAWQRVASLMPVRIDVFGEHERTPHETMSACLRHGIERADQHDAASLFFNPDLIFADGTIDALVARVKAGRRVVFTTGIRLLKETVTAEIEWHRHADAIALAPRELAAIALRNLHPISRQNIWTDDGGTLVPATLFWPVGNEGLAARCFHLHPLLVWPERKGVVFTGTVDDDFVSMACPRDEADHVVTDSDELMICEISDFSRASETAYRRGSIDDVVDWAESHADARHRRLATFPIRFRAAPATEPRWADVEAESQRVVGEVLRRLDYNWLQVLLRSPTRLLRRWVRIAATASILLRNHRNEGGWRTRIAEGYLDFYRRYGAFCAGYERFRQRLDDVLFGPADHPYPWNGRSFTIGLPVSTALRLLPDDRAQTLIIAPQADIAKRLANAVREPHVLEWPQAGVAATTPALEHWPYDDGAFRLVIDVEALRRAPHPDAFLSELARVMAPGGRAIIVNSFFDGDPEPASDNLPAALTVERHSASGRIGSLLAARFANWTEYQHRVHRISPVILEIPLLPLLILVRFLAGCLIAIGAKGLDVLDRTGRYRACTAMVLVKRGTM